MLNYIFLEDMRPVNSSERFIASSIAGETKGDMNVLTADELAAQGFDRVSRRLLTEGSEALVSIKSANGSLTFPESQASFIRTPTDVVLIVGARPNLTRAFRFGLDELRSQPEIRGASSQPQVLPGNPFRRGV